MGRRRGPAIYTHEIELRELRIENAPRAAFADALTKIPYRGYQVEDISDGRKIVIIKPGGKRVWGVLKKEDFVVFIYNPQEKTLWQISHDEILADLTNKSQIDVDGTIAILEAFEKVYNGQDPDTALQDTAFTTVSGETPEALMKAYKWIWGQEDVNYPNLQGRAMSWEGLSALLATLRQTKRGRDE